MGADNAGRLQTLDAIQAEIWRQLEAATGETINFDKVLMVSDAGQLHIGAPLLAGAKVTAEVVSQGRHDKVHILKFRRRKHHMKQAGHRQWYTEVKITAIQAG